MERPSSAETPRQACAKKNVMRPGSHSLSLRRAIVGFSTLLVTIMLVMVIVQTSGGPEKLHEMVRQAGPWAPALYVVLKALTMVIAPLSGTPIKVAAGALFGLRDGTIYVALGDLVGGSVNFWIARLLGKRMLVSVFGTTGWARMEDLSRRVGNWRTLLFAQVILHAVYDFVSYAAGLTALPFYQYVLVSALGGILWSAALVAFGAGLIDDPSSLLLAAAALACLYLLTTFLGRRKRIEKSEGGD